MLLIKNEKVYKWTVVYNIGQLYVKMDNILKYFIENPEKEFYVRELSKLTRKSPTTISKYLNKFKKEDLLISNRKLNHFLFKANSENKEFKDIKLRYNLKKIRKSGLLDHFIDKFNDPKSIILFGSFAKAENIEKSDIDILVITPNKKKICLDKFENILKHNIQLFQHSEKEIDAMKSKNKELLNTWVNGFILYGYWELFR